MTSREKFEAWYLENWGHTEDDHETLFERDPDSDEEYYRLGVRMAHGAWQASELASQQKLTDIAVQLANADSKCRELAAENAEMRSSIDATIGWQESTDPENGESVRMLVDIKTPATDAFLAEVRAHDLNAFIRHHSAELDAHIKNGGEQFDEKSVRIRDIIVSARLFREQIRKEAAQ